MRSSEVQRSEADPIDGAGGVSIAAEVCFDGACFIMSKAADRPRYAEPPWATIASELKRNGVTLTLLWAGGILTVTDTHGTVSVSPRSNNAPAP